MRCFLTGSLVVLGFVFEGRAGGDSEGTKNLADETLLPSGAGLAHAWTTPDQWGSGDAIVFHDDFENGVPGETWDDRRDETGDVLSKDSPGDVVWLGKSCLKVDSRLDRDTGGGFTKWFEPVDPVFVRFYTKFDGGCDYVHHFVTLRANRGLRGGDRWSGFGGAGLRPKGDERFSTAIEPWGNNGQWTPPGRWNFYSYWHEMEASGDGKFWGNSFGVPSSPEIPRNQWICVEFMLKHNEPGRADGEQAFWIDGRLIGHWKGINWRKNAALQANALTLETYVTDRWTKNPRNIVWFDNVVVAREYIGPERGSPALLKPMPR
jgi:hypothetical protein